MPENATVVLGVSVPTPRPIAVQPSKYESSLLRARERVQSSEAS